MRNLKEVRSESCKKVSQAERTARGKALEVKVFVEMLEIVEARTTGTR